MNLPPWSTRIGLLLATLLACGATAAEIELDRHGDGTDIEAAIGDVLVLRVVGNASTGYAWQRIDDGRGVLVQMRGGPTGEAKPERPIAIGGPTTQVRRFRAEKTGTSELRFVYRQPWRKDAAPERERAWRVIVH